MNSFEEVAPKWSWKQRVLYNEFAGRKEKIKFLMIINLRIS